MGFGKFDQESDEDKEQLIQRFHRKQRMYEKLEGIWKPTRFVLLMLFTAGAVLLILIGISAIPKTIDLQYPAVEYRGNDPSYVDHTTITVKGKYVTKWFAEPRFTGQITVEKYPFTENNPMVELTFYPDLYPSAEQGLGFVYYSSYMDGLPGLHFLGNIIQLNDFESMGIQVSEPLNQESSSYEGLILAAPATTREEAVNITNALQIP